MFRIAKRSRRNDKSLLLACRKAARTARVNPASLAKATGLDLAQATAVLTRDAHPAVGSITKVALHFGLNPSDFCRESPKYHVHFRDHNGMGRRIPASSNREDSTEFGRRVERLVSVRRTRGEMPPEILHWLDGLPAEEANRLVEIGLVEKTVLTTTQPLAEHVEAWVEAMRKKGSTEKHLQECARSVKLVFEAAGVREWAEVSPERVEAALDRVPTKGNRPVTPQLRNKLLGQTKQFGRFMLKTRRARSNPLSALEKVRATPRVRRALSREEAACLVEAARTGGVLQRIDKDGDVVWGATGAERHAVYSFTLSTGMRAGSLGKLTVGDFHLDDACPHVLVRRENEKNRQPNRVPLHPELAKLLREQFKLKAPAAVAFNVPEPGETAWMVRRDLEAAKQVYVAQARGPEERSRRAADHFLAVDVPGAMPFDFHSLRTTAATLLQEGGVPIAFVARILNQKTLAVTAGSYTQPSPATLYAAVRGAAPLRAGVVVG